MALFAYVIACSGVFAKNINFQVVQNNPGQEDVFATSYLFEQALVDFFFESGHIVSNSPVCIKGEEGEEASELKKVLVETLLGSMDYLVRVQVDYNAEKSKNANVMLLECVRGVSWKTYAASSGKLISSGKLVPEKIDNTNNNENGIYNFASLAASKISAGLKSAK